MKHPSKAASASTILCVFMTGAAAMLYQVAWQRYLARLLGGDAAATAVVLAAFLGGLSAGYWGFGRISARVTRPFRAYALAEAGIGLWGLAFPAVFAMVQAASSGLSLSSPWLLAFQGFALATVLTGPPTVLMGATMPLLTQALSRDVESAGSVHAVLYGVNTAGAFLGAVAGGYLAVPGLGLPGTLVLAASLNLLAAAWFGFARQPLARTAPVVSGPARGPSPAAHASGASAASADGVGAARAKSPPSPALPHRPDPGRALAAPLMALALVNGVQTMTLENVLVRFVGLSVGSTAYAFSMVVAVFVLAIAAGAFWASRARGDASRALWVNQMLIAAALLAVYPTLDTWPYWAHRLRLLFSPDEAGFWGFQAAGFAVLALVVAPPAAFIGAAVPLVFSRLRRELGGVGRLSGRILCVNTLGNLAGSLAAGLLLHPFLNNGQLFLLCAVLALAGAFLAARGMSPGFKAVPAAAALAGLALLPSAPLYDPGRFLIGTFRTQFPLPYSHEPPAAFYREYHSGAEALFHEDGPEASAAVVRAPKLPWSAHAPLAILVNGKSDSSTVSDTATLKLLAHLPALFARDRSSALVIGLGTGVTSAELLLHPDVVRVDTAEISSSVIRALPHFAPFTRGLHADPRHNLVHADALRVLARAGGGYGLIVSEPSNPWVSGVDALFSREFYRMARERLSPGGIFVQWIHIQDASERVLASVLATLRSEFASVRAFMSQANDLVMLATGEPLGDEALERAARALAGAPLAAASLEEAGTGTLESLLAREIALPELAGEIETLDRPRIHYMAGKSYFKGERVPTRLLLGGADDPGWTLLARHAARRLKGPLTAPEAEALAGSAVDRRSEEEAPLPMRPALERRLARMVPR